MGAVIWTLGCERADRTPKEVDPRPDAAEQLGPSTSLEQHDFYGIPEPVPSGETGHEALLEGVLSRPSLPGDVEMGENRATVLMRARGEPVYFTRTPQYTGEVSDDVRYFRHRLRASEYPWEVLDDLLPVLRKNPEEARQVLLREGYLYASDPELAFALVSLVTPEDLFQGERIWLQRGQSIRHATRSAAGYIYDEGPWKGERARLLMFDRVGSGDAPKAPALHLDFRTLSYELGFERVRVRHLGEKYVYVDLLYGNSLWVPTLLAADGPKLALVFEKPSNPGALSEQRALARTRTLGIQALRRAMLLQIDERLPFDEPRREVGQEDGKMRRSFVHVYEQGRQSFHIRDVRYPVFDELGRPLAPQVCVDFLLDTFERASGTWWAKRGEPPARVIGRIDFEQYADRDLLRRTEEFLNFARSQDDLFEVFEFREEERIEQGNKEPFFQYLERHAELFRPGDMVFIRGLTPSDRRIEHYHSFFVYEVDPVTGVPIAIAGNAGTPAIWSWESEARRTPERTLRYRVRPTDELLRRVAGDFPEDAVTPPPLVGG